MTGESAYDSARLPFMPDLERGYWAKPSDFIFTGISLAFRLDTLASLFPAYNGYASILTYLILFFAFVVPLFVMQSFLGQFSSSGFISAFRIAPLLKGIGYISLAVNFGVLTYYSTFAAVPLFYLFNSMRPTLPWSCEGMRSWSYKLSDAETKHTCHLLYNDTNDQDILYNGISPFLTIVAIPSNLFFRTLFENPKSLDGGASDFNFSAELVLCTLIVWMLIAGVFYKMNKIEKLSLILRRGIFIVLIILLIIVIRFFLVLNDPWLTLFDALLPDWRGSFQSIPNAGIYIVGAFGAGWGSVIALASFNKFQTPIKQNCWTICCGQMLVFLSFIFITYATNNYFGGIYNAYRKRHPMASYGIVENVWVLFLSTGSVMADMKWPNLWCILYFTMLFLAALITMQGSLFHFVLSPYTIATQAVFNVLVILVVLWVYGRVRFQRDIEYMLSQRFATWKVYILRFVSPLYLMFMLILSLTLAIAHRKCGNLFTQITAFLFFVILWLCIPGYMIYIMLKTAGTLKTRFKRCVRPLDWYPLELVARQRYEEVVRRADVTPQLNLMDNDVVNM